MRRLASQGEAFANADTACHETLLAPLPNGLLRQLAQAFWEIHTVAVPLLGIAPAERTTAYQPRFQVLDTTGHPVQARWPAMLEHLTLHKTPTGKTADQAESQQAAGHHGPDPTRIAPTTGGAGFNLANCVDTLLHNILQLTA